MQQIEVIEVKRKSRFSDPRVLRMALICLVILAAGIAVLIYFGNRKLGFHEDEIYSFFSSNRTAGVAWPDGDWLPTSAMADEMVVLPNERFNYGMVKTVQSWDVHPPLYYYILHTACSLYPGLFSKWLGIGVNIAAYVLCFLMLLLICRQCRLTDFVTAVFLLIWSLHPMTVSCVMFIRMYMWLTFFVLACLYFHLRILERFTKLRMAAVMIVSFLGFLTHYYYLIFFFFTGVTTCLLWFLQKTPDSKAKNMSTRIGMILRYVSFCVACLGAAVLYYPSALSHIFRGYRGKEAIGSFFNLSEWGGRLLFFGGLLNEDVFSGVLPLLLLMFSVLAIAGGRAERKLRSETILIFVPVLMYFLVVSGTGLILGDTSNRYMMPVYPLMLMLVMSAGDYLIRRLSAYWKPKNSAKKSMKYWKASRAALFALFSALFLFIDLGGLFIDDHVLFLYPENKIQVQTASQNRMVPTVVLYNSETPDNIWRLYDKLKEFPELYFLDSTGDAEVEDETLAEADRFYVFAADTMGNDDRDASIDYLISLGEGQAVKEELYRRDMWTWLEVKRDVPAAGVEK